MRTAPECVETKTCARCKQEKPASEFRRFVRKDRPGPRLYSYCRYCEGQRHKLIREEARKNTQPGDLPSEKKCSKCCVVKPSSEFHARVQYKKWALMSICKACSAARRQEWKVKNRERDIQRRRNYYAAMRSSLKLLNVEGIENVDMLRKALIDSPRNLDTEDSRAAYFRGYAAGAARSKAESATFDKLQDLCHRIASELSKYGKAGNWQSYEDNVAVAYEGLLAFIRKRRRYESDEHMRKSAAKAIRHAIIDYTRAHGPYGRTGKKRGGSEYEIPLGEDGEALIEPVAAEEASEELSDALDGLELDDRDRKILGLLSQGYTAEDAGKQLGISGSRVGQLMKELRESRGEALLAVLQG
jgi:RNA polymerase sigma factor (sigma-70 family)